MPSKNIRFCDLYRLDFPDGKSYIGACTCGGAERYKRHQKAVKGGSTLPVHKAWRRLGPPILIILKKNMLEEKLWSAEKQAIIKYGTKVPYGYNGYDGRDKAPGMLDKKHSENTLKIMSDAKKGKRHSLEHIEAVRQANLGKKRTREARINMGVAQKRRFENPQEREKARQGTLHYFEDPLARKRTSLSNLRRFKDPLERKKLSLGQRRRWNNPEEHKKQVKGSSAESIPKKPRQK